MMLPQRAQLMRFIVAGAFNTGCSYVIYAALLSLGMAYSAANLAAIAGGVLIGFVTQGRFVFGAPQARRLPVFAVAWLALWGLNVLVIRLLMPMVGGNAYVAGALALAVMVPLSYLVQKHLVFGGRFGR